jgi:predicted Zn-dependent protease with MMP-like domain
MIDVATEDFEKLVGDAIDAQPEKYMNRLNNVVFVVEDEPTSEQREKLRLRCNESLFGLYEGIPQTQRGGNYTFALPDKITVFRLPILFASYDMQDLKNRLKHTVWHEVAHHFGLKHEQIHALDGTNTGKNI